MKSHIKLIRPSKVYAPQIWQYRQEFLEADESLAGAFGLDTSDSAENWIETKILDEREETMQKGFVSATTYFAINTDDNQLVGIIQLRHRLNEFLMNFGGHCGYSIRSSERRKGYATEMLRLVKEEAKKMGLKKILVVCDKENIASAKTILSNGGILENEVLEDGEITQRYWINLV